MDRQLQLKQIRTSVPAETMKAWATFLSDTPANVSHVFSGLICGRMGGLHGDHLQLWIPLPEIDLPCTVEGEVRSFTAGQEFWISGPDSTITPYLFRTFVCRNCGKARRTIAFVLEPGTLGTGDVEIMKLGEFPPFAAAVVSKEFKRVLGDTFDLYQQGVAAERIGLGIGASAYYRRIVEGKWRVLVEAMKTAAVAIAAPSDVLDRFDRALKETQFSKAVDDLKDGFPEQLKISGVNPITVLHNSLSIDIHRKTDADCLKIASSTRQVLKAMVETIERVKADDAALREAVKNLQ